MTKAGCHPSGIDFLTLDGLRFVMGVRLQPMAVAFSLGLKEWICLQVQSTWHSFLLESYLYYQQLETRC